MLMTKIYTFIPQIAKAEGLLEHRTLEGFSKTVTNIQCFYE